MSKPRGIALMLGVTAVAVAAGAGNGATTDEPVLPAASASLSAPDRPPAVPDDAPPWLAGLLARSEGLNRLYGLGEYAPRGKPGDDLPGLKARSEALNRMYGLGG